MTGDLTPRGLDPDAIEPPRPRSKSADRPHVDQYDLEPGKSVYLVVSCEWKRKHDGSIWIGGPVNFFGEYLDQNEAITACNGMSERDENWSGDPGEEAIMVWAVERQTYVYTRVTINDRPYSPDLDRWAVADDQPPKWGDDEPDLDVASTED